MSVYYLKGQSNSGNTRGLTGYYYPLYTDESLVPNERYHAHTFAGLDNEVFYMPEDAVNHGVANPPAESYYGNYMYQEYATYNVINTVISYTDISTAQSQAVISIASNGIDYDPFDNSAENTESLRVEELIPEQLRGSSERFVTLIKDYYTHLNSEGLPTYETNRIVDEHDIDEISSKYLDGIQGEIAKNIPDSNVMDRVSLYKKIVQYYTLKGSEESITTFFRLFFDEIIEVSYPKERLFELSAGDWRKDEEDYAHVITAAVRSEDLGTQYNWTPFQMKDDSDIILGTGNIVSAEEIVLHDIPPAINSLVFNVNAKKNLNSINQTWDSVELDNTVRGYFYEGASFNQYESLVKFNGKGSLVDFGEIYTNPDIPIDTEEHTFVVRAFPRSNKEDTEIQPLFSLSKNYESLHSHELFFNKNTRKIGRSFIDTGEPRIELDTDGISYVFSNFIDQTSADLISLSGDRLDHMNSFLSPLGEDYNGKWKKTLIQFPKNSGNFVYVHENDPILDNFTQDDLRFYTFDASSNTFNGPNNLKIGDSIYGEGEEDFTNVIALSKDGFTVAVGSSLNDPEHIPGTKLRHGTMTGEFKVGDTISQTIGSITVTGDVSYVGEDFIFSSLSSQVASDGSNTTFAETSGSDPSKITAPRGNSFVQAEVTLVDSSGLRGNNAGSVKVYTLATHKLKSVPSTNRAEIVIQTLSNEAGVRSFIHFEVGDSLTMAGETFTITEVDLTSGGQIDWTDFNTSPGTQYPYAHSHTVVGLDRYPSITNNISTTIPNGTLIKVGDANVWSQIGSTIDGEKAGDLFGSDVAINAYGNRIAIGAPKRQSEATDGPLFNGAPTAFNSTPEDENFTGEIQVWNLRHNTSVWENLNDEYIAGRVPTDPFKGLKNSRLGTNISMDASGRYLAYGSGANPNIDFDIGTEDGAGILLEDGGAIVGAKTPARAENELPEVAVWYDHGGATGIGISLNSNPVWIHKGNITVSNDASTGVTVKLSENGERLLIGTHQNNESGLSEMVVKLFGYMIEVGDSTTTWRQIGQDVTFIADKNKDQVPISFSSDGTKFAVGILGDGTDETFKGQVKAYSLETFDDQTFWVQYGQTLEGKNARDAFGSSVNLNSAGNVVVIGSPGNDESDDDQLENDVGKAQVFSYSSDEQAWEQVGSDILGTGNADGAGTAVSINSTGSRVSIASPGNDEDGQNKGKIESFQVSLEANIREFMLLENNPLDAATNRWAVKSKDKVVYYTDWESTMPAPYDVGVKWYKGSKQGDENLPALPHCECVKNNNGHLFTLHNRGYLSIFYKHNNEYTPWQDITIGSPTTYGGERLWDILDYAVNGDYLILLDRPVNEASRLVVLKVDEYNRYNFYQTVSLNLPSTHLGSADFAHIKSTNSQIIVGTHTFNNVNIAQVIQIYDIGENNLWSSDQYSTLPSANVTPVLSDLEFNINKNVVDGKWTSTNNLTRFDSSVISGDSSSDDGIIFDRSRETVGSGLGFNINNKFAVSLRFNVRNTFSAINNILTIGNVTLRLARNPLTNKKELQIVSQEPDKTDYPVFLNKIGQDIILDDNPLETFSDEYFDKVLPNKWNNLTVEFTVNAQNLISGLRYSLNGFKRSKSLETESESFSSSSLARHGITSSSQLTLYNTCAFSHISFYDKELTHIEFESLERDLSTNYTETITTGINSLLDGGKFDISETGTIIAKVSDSGIHIWEKISSVGWRNFYNTLTSITDSADNYITHNGSRLYSFKFFGDDLLIANGGLNNAKQFVDQYNSSTTYNKAQHNSRSKLYYIQSQYINAHDSWKLKREFAPSVTFSQSNDDDFRVGLNYGVDIAVDSANNAFAVSLEPDSVNKILNGPTAELFNDKNTTNVKYDVYRKLNDNFRLVPYFRPNEGFSEVISYGRRLNLSAVLKILNSSPSYNASLAFPNLTHTTLPENPMVEYKYRSDVNSVGYYKDKEHNGDFVISTAPSSAVYSTSNSASLNSFNTVILRGNADRYNGYVDISVNGSNFERIIEGNTLRHLTISPESKFILGKSGSGSFNGEISHSQYYTEAISNSSRDKIVSYYIKNVKNYYKITLDDIKGSAIGATKLTSIPFTNKSFVLDDLTGHAFTSFLIYEEPEFKLDQTDPNTGALIENPNTSIRLIADYGENITADEVVYWGDGRSARVLNSSPVIHTYTLEYLGEYFDKKGRASSTGRIQDSVFWQKFSYVIKSGLKVDDWESTFLNLVHPAGLRFFASVILLVIRDNHWFGPKYLGFNAETRENYSTLRVEDKYLAPFRTKQPVEDMRWLEGLTAPNDNGGYHLPMFQPGWLQGDIRVREFMFEAGLWTKLARSVPGNDLSSKYTYEYFENGAESGDIEFRILSHSGDTVGDPAVPFQVGDVVSSGADVPDPNDTNTPPRSLQKRGIIETIATAGTNSAGVMEYTGILKSFSVYDPIYVNPRDPQPTIDIAYFGPDRIDTDGDTVDDAPSRDTVATISTVKVRKKEEVINVYGTAEQDAAYLLQDQSSINVNSEMFIRAVLMTFKYVIPSLVPLKEFTKRDYEQNLKFKDIDDISSYLPITIKDALNNSDVFMNVGALIRKRNQLFTEPDTIGNESNDGDGIFLERDTDLTGADQGLLIDDIAQWYNDPTNDDDISIPVQLNITSYTGPQIQEADIVYQDIVDDAGNNLTIEGLVVRTLNSGNSILVGWRSAINTDTTTVLPSKPELDQLFQDGEIYTVVDPYGSPPDNTRQTAAQITINT